MARTTSTSIPADRRKRKSFLVVTAQGSKYVLARKTSRLVKELLEKYGHLVSDIPSDDTYDLVISVGGDGTVLDALREYSPRGIPVLGINAGNVGFLTAAEARGYERIVQRIIFDNYDVEKRFGLCCTWNGKTYGPFVNEVLLEHPETQVGFSAAIGETSVWKNLMARGLLLATATGSTAQNAAARGPVILPGSNNVALTPLQPGLISAIPLVLHQIGEGGSVTFKVMSDKNDVSAALYGDGVKYSGEEGVQVGDSVTIERYSHPALLATFGLDNYFDALHNKKGFAR